MNCTVKRRPLRRNHNVFAPHFGNIINEVMNSSFENVVKKAPVGSSTPSANVSQKEDQFILTLALPGYKKEEIAIKMEKNNLTISSKKETTGEAKFRLQEFNYGAFERSFRIPRDIDKESIEAKFENGLLTLVFNKKPEAKAKSISIN